MACGRRLKSKRRREFKARKNKMATLASRNFPFPFKCLIYRLEKLVVFHLKKNRIITIIIIINIIVFIIIIIIIIIVVIVNVIIMMIMYNDNNNYYYNYNYGNDNDLLGKVHLI